MWGVLLNVWENLFEFFAWIVVLDVWEACYNVKVPEMVLDRKYSATHIIVSILSQKQIHYLHQLEDW